jgi:predicted nucleic acid-binding protein
LIVLDASFLVKLVLEEMGSRRARELTRSWARGGETLATVDLALPEALNAIWKHAARIGDLSPHEAIESAGDLLRLWRMLKIYPSSDLAGEALRLALGEAVTVYDALYIQLAKSAGSSLATYDKKLAEAARRHGIPVYP